MFNELHVKLKFTPASFNGRRKVFIFYFSAVSFEAFFIILLSTKPPIMYILSSSI